MEKTKPDDIINFTNRGYDTVASFYLSRCVDFNQKETFAFPSFFRNKIYKTTVLIKGNTYVEKRRQLRHKQKRGTATKIIPKMEFRGLFVNTGEIVIYLSQDKYRIPLMMTSQLSVGKFKAILIERGLTKITD